MAVPGSVFPLCQGIGKLGELLLFELINPAVSDGHTAVFAKSFARNFRARWILPALVFSAVS